MTSKPYAPSCDRNRDVILAVLREQLGSARSVLEIGSGTGQHAVHFAAALPQLRWQCSECAEALPGLSLWLDEAALRNLPPALALDVAQPWPALQVEAVFTANTLHIMSWPQVEALFAHLPEVLLPGGRLIVYGPFNYGGRFTSQSNADFDVWLKNIDVQRGLRDFEAVNALAEAAGLRLLRDQEMPSNNRCLVWQRPAVHQAAAGEA